MEDLSTITGRIIPALLVTQLKLLIKSLNENIRPSPQLKLGGNKSELIQRLVAFITHHHQLGDQVAIRQIRHCIAAFNQGEVSTIATPSVALQHPHGSSSSSSSSGYRIHSGNMLTSKPTSTPVQQSQMGVRPQVPHYMTMARSGVPENKIVFKSSPFYKDIQVLSPARLCIEAKEQRTMSVTLPFTVAPMLSVQLRREPEYQIMVFCTSVEGAANPPALMEFPHVCEIKISGRVLEANLRGMKNKPGTVSPANITRLCRLDPAEYNKVEFIYANSPKRYYASVNLVKKSSVATIVAEIERGKFLSKEQMLRILEDRNKDDDIMATSSTLSLKCPLGFQRITVPIRSSYCQHLQCFDAYTFFNLNEQTPTWTCPVCSRMMHSWEEIVVDGYFKDLLNSTPESLESITVQADGSWELPSASAKSGQVIAPSPKKKAAPTDGSVFIIDEDDDEDEAPAAAPITPVKPAKPAIEVIDLISDSEEEGDEEPTTQAAVTTTVSTSTAVDPDGDSSMQEAANSLQNMAHATPGPSAAVKTEDLERPAPVENETVPTAPEAPSVIGSASRSPVASSEASPVISNRMIQTEPVLPQRTGSPAAARTPPVWENSEEMFMNALLNPRKRRQLDDALDNQNINNMSYENRQRMARLDIRSNGSSDRGSSSAMPSPDVIRRSTSSPTPVPSFHELDRRSAGDYHSDYDDATQRTRRDHILSRVAAMPYYENGNADSRIPVTSSHQSYAPIHRSPQHRQSHNSQGSFGRNSRSATKSPPLHHGYNVTSHPHHHHTSHHAAQQHYHPHHRSTNSPGPDYYSSSSRPLSGGHRSTEAALMSRSSSVGMSRQSSNLTSLPPYGGSSTAWSPTESGHLNGGSFSPVGSGDRGGHGWGPEHGSTGHLSGNVHLNHSNSPRRISGDEVRGTGAASPSSGHFSHAHSHHIPPTSSSSSSQHYPSFQSHSQSMQHHQRHRSADDRWDDQNGGSIKSGGGAHYRADYNTNGDEGRGIGGYSHGIHSHSQPPPHPQQQHQHHYQHQSQQQQHQHHPSHHVYSSSQGNGGLSSSGGSGGYMDDRRRSDGEGGGMHVSSSSARDDEAPIFPNGIRGARAR
ncbi:SUMO ligase siz1, partial [Linnemannia schmuckeri]